MRRAGGPPGWSLQREYSLHGGARAMSPMRPDQQSFKRWWNTLSSRMSRWLWSAMSNGSKWSSLILLAYWLRGEVDT